MLSFVWFWCGVSRIVSSCVVSWVCFGVEGVSGIVLGSGLLLSFDELHFSLAVSVSGSVSGIALEMKRYNCRYYKCREFF